MKKILVFEENCPEHNKRQSLTICYLCKHRLRFEIIENELIVCCLFNENETKKIINHNQKLIMDMDNKP